MIRRSRYIVSIQLLMATACFTVAGTQRSSTDVSSVDTYKFISNVADCMRMDLDLEEMTLSMSTNLDKAKRVYSQGSHSNTYAEVTVQPLPRAVDNGELVRQASQGIVQLRGQIIKAAPQGFTKLQVAYTSLLRACFKSGIEKENCFNSDYTMNADKLGTVLGVPLQVSNYFRSFASFSKLAQAQMAGEKYYTLYYDYFATGDYAHQQVTHALEKTGPFANVADTQVHANVVKTAILSLTVWMEVVHWMERARAKCSLLEWERALALYGGSTWNTLHGGYMLYGLAISLCNEFVTCDVSGTSTVNKNIIQLFEEGRAVLVTGDCSSDGLNPITENIVRQMSVPLVQGLLESAFKLEANQRSAQPRQRTRVSHRAHGHIYATATLPLLVHCDVSVAQSTNDMMRLDAAQSIPLDFSDLKSLIESTYDCLGITCADVGGLVDHTKGSGRSYFKGAEACGIQGAPNEGVSTLTIILICSTVVCLVCCCGLALVLYRRLCRRTSEDSKAMLQNARDEQREVEVIRGSPVTPGVVGSQSGVALGNPSEANDEKGRPVHHGVEVGTPLRTL